MLEALPIGVVVFRKVAIVENVADRGWKIGLRGGRFLTAAARERPDRSPFCAKFLTAVQNNRKTQTIKTLSRLEARNAPN